ncbi:hypothetical protein RJX39_00650 [Buchnera aphidicola (Taiwanaphis decaspermi)]
MKNLILVINCGSSSLKFAVINIKNKKKYLHGIAELLSKNKSRITYFFEKITKTVILKKKLTIKY